MFTPGNHQCLEEEAAEERELGARIISTNANDLACTGFYRGHEGLLSYYGSDDEEMVYKFCDTIVMMKNLITLPP